MKTKRTIKVNHWQDATECRLLNRRITCYSQADNTGTGGITIELKKLVGSIEEANTPCAIHTNKGNKVVTTELQLSDEGALALLIALNEELRKKSIIK